MDAVGTRTVAATVALTMLVCVVAIGGREPLRGTTGESTETRRAPERVTKAANPRQGPLPPEVFVFYPDEESTMPAWLPWAIVGVVAAGIATAGLLLVRSLLLQMGRRPGRRRAGQTAPGSTAAEAADAHTGDDTELVRRAVEAALKPPDDPMDPRAAVIAAYARMEQVLARRELSRRTSEAPREYLTRVLREQGMPEGSLTTLTALFEEARFSLHPISDRAPSRALAELQKARTALAAMDGAAPTV